MYNALAPYYDDIYPHEEFAASFSDAVSAITEYLDPGKQIHVLDLCCGTGRALSLFGHHPRAKLYGVDAAETMLKSAAMNFAGRVPPPHFTHKDVRELSPSDFEVKHFDLVMMTGASILQFPPSDRRNIFNFILRVLRPGGLFLFDTLKGDTGFKPGSSEFKVRRSFVIDGRRVVFVYIRHYELDLARHYSLVLKFRENENDLPEIECDSIVFYPLTADAGRHEAAGAGLCHFDLPPISYEPSTFICMMKDS